MTQENGSDEELSEQGFLRRINLQMLGKLSVIVVLMFGFGYALIPMYKKICELTGINLITPQDGTVERPKNSQIDTSRTITIEFDGNAQGPWRFRPTTASVQVHPGQMSQVVYEVVNKQNYAVVAQAIPSYAPQQAAGFFKKVECFCFNQQTLGPNEAKQMQVVFYIDPALPKDVKTITLSYTFFEVPGAAKKVEKV
jgi:cytochrome c oxidase assembly protein subunit 11